MADLLFAFGAALAVFAGVGLVLCAFESLANLTLNILQRKRK